MLLYSMSTQRRSTRVYVLKGKAVLCLDALIVPLFVSLVLLMINHRAQTQRSRMKGSILFQCPSNLAKGFRTLITGGKSEQCVHATLLQAPFPESNQESWMSLESLTSAITCQSI